MTSKKTVEDKRVKEAIEVAANYSTDEYPDIDDVVREGDIQITAMIPRPPEMEADVTIGLDGTVCFKVTAKVCRTVWKKGSSGRLVRVQKCSLGDVTICMDRFDWS